MAPEELSDIFVANLKNMRGKQGLSQESLAEKTDLSHSFIRQLENKQSSFSIDSLVAVAKALNCEPCDLLMTVDELKIISAYREASDEKKIFYRAALGIV